MDKSPDQRPPLAVAMEWSSRITTIALEMVLPGAAGYWLDLKLGTRIVFLVIGVVLGFSVAMLHLIQLTKPQKPSNGPK